MASYTISFKDFERDSNYNNFSRQVDLPDNCPIDKMHELRVSKNVDFSFDFVSISKYDLMMEEFKELRRDYNLLIRQNDKLEKYMKELDEKFARWKLLLGEDEEYLNKVNLS